MLYGVKQLQTLDWSSNMLLFVSFLYTVVRSCCLRSTKQCRKGMSIAKDLLFVANL